MGDFKSIIRSPVFPFLVGSGKARLTIHTEVIRNLSSPLFNLINNGLMKESIEGHAMLEDVEEDTFIGFCEFAYLGAYKTPQRSEKTDDTNLRNSTEREGEQDVLRDEPEAAAAEEHSLQPEPEPEPEPEKPEPVPSFRSNFAYGIPLQERPPIVTYVQYPYDGLWEQFRQLRFAGREASPSTVPDLVFHGKLYVFATRYLVDSLRTQCLRSLHRDLCELSLNKRNIPHVLDLIEYAYQESGRGEPEGGSSLRNLVIHYAACEARTLAEDPRLRELLDRFSEMGSDLVTKLLN